jgi:SAM-dependent methyltransferase
VVIRKVRSFVKMLVRQGPVTAFRTLAHRAYERYHERRLGIVTSPILLPKDLGFDDPRCREYGPTTYRDFSFVMRHLRLRPWVDVFLDLGSGMGRVMILAAEYPFRRVLGVEFSADLVKIADDNVARSLPKLRCKDVRSVTADAGSYEIPADVTVAFFNNSFHGELFGRCLANMEKSVKEAPRPFRLICSLPPGSTHIQGQVNQSGFLRERETLRLPSGRTCVIYETGGAGGD